MRRRVKDGGKGIAGLIKGYRKVLDFCLKYKAVPIIASVVLLAVTGFLAIRKGFEFMPAMESTQIMGQITLDEELTFDEVVDVCDEMAAEIKALDGVELVGSMEASGLTSVDEPVQLDLFGNQERRERMERLDAAVDVLRRRYGNTAVRRAVELGNP